MRLNFTLWKLGILSKNRLLNGVRLLNGRGYYYGRYGILRVFPKQCNVWWDKYFIFMYYLRIVHNIASPSWESSGTAWHRYYSIYTIMNLVSWRLIVWAKSRKKVKFCTILMALLFQFLNTMCFYVIYK